HERQVRAGPDSEENVGLAGDLGVAGVHPDELWPLGAGKAVQHP
ncbi:MAG: hypothetical protein QOH19_2621, partial [Actinomycetota bacterium]|nr:hypothetical protein [Actinomycetota bacterium]